MSVQSASTSLEHALRSEVGFCFIVYLASNKYDSPYAWWFVDQPSIHGELQPATLPLFRGLWLSPLTLQTFQTVTVIVEKYTTPRDAIYVFPHMPVFYLLTGRWPSGRSIVDWFDFLPDEKAKAEAGWLLLHPPAVIIDLEMPEFTWTTHERLFRHGQPMGQRAIRSAIQQLTSRPEAYVLETSIPVPQYSTLGKNNAVSENCVLKIWRVRTARPL